MTNKGFAGEVLTMPCGSWRLFRGLFLFFAALWGTFGNFLGLFEPFYTGFFGGFVGGFSGNYGGLLGLRLRRSLKMPRGPCVRNPYKSYFTD